MPTTKKSRRTAKNESSVVRENARVGYQAAVNMWAEDSGTIWSRYSIMVLANSILIAAIGLVLTSRPLLIFLATWLPVAGVILCLMWYMMMKRAFDYATYLVRSAVELEEGYLKPPVKTFSRGGLFSDGKQVEMVIGGKSEQRRMSAWSRLLMARQISYVVILIFAIVYLSCLIQLLLMSLPPHIIR